jgi:hypothetical protein
MLRRSSKNSDVNLGSFCDSLIDDISQIFSSTQDTASPPIDLERVISIALNDELETFLSDLESRARQHSLIQSEKLNSLNSLSAEIRNLTQILKKSTPGIVEEIESHNDDMVSILSSEKSRQWRYKQLKLEETES